MGFVDKSLRRLYITLALLVVSSAIGILGFHFIEGYTFVESLFMTAITLSTVGYKTVKPLSDGGMVFVSLYIGFNLVIFAYMVSVLTSYLFEGELQKVFQTYMDTRELKKIKSHTIICGFGRNGSRAAEELSARGQTVIVIDQKDDIIVKAKELKGVKIVKGDATEDDVLETAGIGKAQTLITTLPNDADNIFITLTAKELNPTIMVISRASSESTVSKLRRSGAEHVVMPDNLGGLHMARLITQPYVIEFLELLGGIDTRFVLKEFNFDQFKKEYRHQTIRQLNVREVSGANIIACKKENAGFEFNPAADYSIDEGVVFILLGKETDLSNFEDSFIG